ncbi:transporter [Falsochrobactrum shanghaiense]|uniref:Transporter n=1 Tax=Falsochrobactrum shanghaiense TaxID=2201899 RepID=A0A316J910_9HYPH|nr:OmpP1/FadL family transporter [Falsochrobactrum shanghaiense]PWL17964.1 transporter [Falsochrobactrum shanghaiense]
MDLRHVKLVGAATVLLGGAVNAQAGGFERNLQDFDILFEQGNVVDTTATYVMPQRKLRNIHGSGIGAATGGINPLTGNPYSTSVKEAQNYWVPKLSAKFDLTDDLACAAQYRQPWGVHTDAGMDTVRMYVAIEQKIASHDYGLNCSYRFAAGEKGYFRILGGVSYQEIRGEQTRLLPASNSLPFRVGTLDVEDNSIGWRIGAAYEIPEYALRASLVYHSKLNYELEGNVGNIIPNTSVGVVGDVTTPQAVEFKFQTGIAPDWLAFGSVKWTNWSSVERISFVNSTGMVYAGIFAPGQEIMALNLFFRDGWTVSGGIGHKFDDQWSAAATLTWDRGTSTGLSVQTDTWMLGLGTNYKPAEQFEIRLAGALGWLQSGKFDDRSVNLSGTGSAGDFGDDIVTALSLTGKIKF